MDFRIYVLVTSCDPTYSVYMYEDGLARLATSKYRKPTDKNIGQVFCHLTNYSINKSSSNFVKTDDAGLEKSGDILRGGVLFFLISLGPPQVYPMGVHRTCGEPNEISQ